MSSYSSPADIVAATLARSANVNDVDAAVATAFALIPDEAKMYRGTVNFGTDSGTANTHVVTTPYTVAYGDGLNVSFIPLATNTSSTTINVNGLGVKSIRDPVGAALAAGLIVVGVPTEVRYSTVTGYFHLVGALSPMGPAGPPGGVSSVDVSGGTTGLSASGGPIVGTGTITLAGTLSAANGGTGVANDAAATTTRSGNYAKTETLTGATNVTYPTTGTLATLAGSEALTNKTLTNPTLGNSNLLGVKTVIYNSQLTLSTTTGAVTVDWSAGQNYKQAEPTGSITYTFTAPIGPCKLQLLIDSDGTSAAQSFTWPATVIWYSITWSGVNNKKAVINFWYDGTSYHATGINQV